MIPSKYLNTFKNSPPVSIDGVFADFFTVAVRTGGPGMNGISLLLIERTMPGVATRHMQCSGVWASGTSYVTFEDVKVPVENIIGKENKGFKAIMVRPLAYCADAKFSHVVYLISGQL